MSGRSGIAAVHDLDMVYACVHRGLLADATLVALSAQVRYQG
jgi:hypothetical protein